MASTVQEDRILMLIYLINCSLLRTSLNKLRMTHGYYAVRYGGKFLAILIHLCISRIFASDYRRFRREQFSFWDLAFCWLTTRIGEASWLHDDAQSHTMIVFDATAQIFYGWSNSR